MRNGFRDMYRAFKVNPSYHAGFRDGLYVSVVIVGAATAISLILAVVLIKP
jgi:hypothetical protein